MLISVQWLSELLPEGGPLDPVRVEEALTALGLEVEGVETHGPLSGVVVGEIRSVEAHPKADRLNVVQLNDGTGEDVQVVCGASNLPPIGGKVAFARVGTSLPGGFEIGVRELRGVQSSGMICSETELNIGPDDSGIIVLPGDWTPGDALASRIPALEDVVIEISVTPNRPDALGHLGVARDLAPKLGRTLVWPETAPLDAAPEDPSLVTVDDPERCGRYFGFALEGATVSEAPPWLRTRLHRVGLRPINDVVDVTNYVLMEYGQPQHAFDRDRLGEGRVVVRRARADEPMTTLDGTEIKLSDEDLVIADASAPQALAGVMGGEGSMVEMSSTNLLLEVAWFAPSPVRRTARTHGFHTDSSHRFERGVDHGAGLEAAAGRALHLLSTLTGARVVGRCERSASSGEGRPAIAEIVLRPPRIAALLGMEIPEDEAASILESIEIAVDRSDPAAWKCRAPTHRPDLTIEPDLIEEVMRHHGLDDLPARATPPTRMAAAEPAASLLERVTDALQATGGHEVVTLAFTGPDELDAVATHVPVERAVSLTNPMRVQSSRLRTSLLPGLLHAARFNAARHDRAIRLFEVGRVYHWPEGASAPTEGPTAQVDRALPDEPEVAASLWCDPASSAAALVRAQLSVLEALGHEASARAAETSFPLLHPGAQAALSVRTADGWQRVGVVGEVHPDLRAKWELAEGPCPLYAEVWIDALPESSVSSHTTIPRFPSTARDLSLDLPTRVLASAVVDAIEAAAAVDGELALAPGDASRTSVEIIEDYRGEGVDAGRRALLLRLHYRRADGSVTDDEVQPVHEAIVAKAVAALGNDLEDGEAPIRVR